MYLSEGTPDPTFTPTTCVNTRLVTFVPFVDLVQP